MGTLKKNKKKRIALIAVLVVLAAVLFDLAATKLVLDGIFSGYDGEPRFNEADYPAAAAAEHEDHTVSVKGGELRTRLYIPSESNGSLVLLVPGMRAGFEDHLPLIDGLLSEGYCVFSFDPTGCRGSGGDDAVGFYRSVTDLEACLDLVEKESLFGCGRLFLIGHSRGGYAICRALETDRDIAGVISIAAPDSPMDAVIGSSSGIVGTVTAYANYPALWLCQAVRFGPGTVTASASSAAAKAEVPVLVLQGADDAVVSPSVHSLYSARDELEGGGVRFMLLSGDHTSVMYDGDGGLNEEFFMEVTGFFDTCVTGHPLG